MLHVLNYLYLKTKLDYESGFSIQDLTIKNIGLAYFIRLEINKIFEEITLKA